MGRHPPTAWLQLTVWSFHSGLCASTFAFSPMPSWSVLKGPVGGWSRQFSRLTLPETIQLCSYFANKILSSLHFIFILVSIPISAFPFWPSFKEFQVSTAASGRTFQCSLVLQVRPTKYLMFYLPAQGLSHRCYQETFPPPFPYLLFGSLWLLQSNTMYHFIVMWVRNQTPVLWC